MLKIGSRCGTQRTRVAEQKCDKDAGSRSLRSYCEELIAIPNDGSVVFGHEFTDKPAGSGREERGRASGLFAIEEVRDAYKRGPRF
jgi:hypothetical protein